MIPDVLFTASIRLDATKGFEHVISTGLVGDLDASAGWLATAR